MDTVQSKVLGTKGITGNMVWGSTADCTKTVHLESAPQAHSTALSVGVLGDRLIQALPGAVEESSLRGIDSELHSCECSESKGMGKEKQYLNSAAVQDRLHKALCAVLHSPFMSWVQCAAQACLQGKAALCFC